MLVSISSRPGSTLVTSLLVATSIPFQPFAGWLAHLHPDAKFAKSCFVRSKATNKVTETCPNSLLSIHHSNFEARLAGPS